MIFVGRLLETLKWGRLRRLCRRVKTRAAFPPAPQASTSKQRLIKKKSSCLSVAPFYLWLHVPFRIEAVIKVLTFSVFFSLMF